MFKPSVRMRRYLCILIALFLCLGAVSCTGPTQSQAAVGATPTPAMVPVTSEPPRTVPHIKRVDGLAYAPPITATTVRLQQPGVAYPEGDTADDNLWTRIYLERLGVRFTPLYDGTEEALSAWLTTAAASQALPDYMVLPYESFYALSKQGLLEPLDNVVEAYASEEVRSALGAYQGAARTAGSLRGSLYGICSAPAMEGDLLWYRDDWFAEAGYTSFPDSLEGFIELCYALSDPARERAGLGAQEALFSGTQRDPARLEALFSAFGAYPTQWVLRNGQLTHGSLQPEALSALAQLQALREDGALALLPTGDGGEALLSALLEGRIGMTLAPYWFVDWLESNRGMSPRNEQTETWSCAPLPGLHGSPNRVPTAARQGYVTCVREGYAYPELSIRMVTLTQELLQGPEAKYRSVIAGEGEIILTARLALAAGGDWGDEGRSQTAAAVQSALLAGPALLTSNLVNFLTERCRAWTEQRDMSSYSVYSQYGPDGSLFQLVDMRARGLLYPGPYYGPHTGSMAEVEAKIFPLRDKAYLSILQGEDAQSSFANYRQLFQSGGHDLTVEVNDWLAAQD